MAAPTVTFDQRKAMYPSGTINYAMITGTVAITSYDNTHPTVTAITGKFKSNIRVLVSGVSSNGYAVGWDNATSSFKAWGSNGASPAALAEAANATNVGNVQFVAIGQVG